jgi:hypothetical protein
VQSRRSACNKRTTEAKTSTLGTAKNFISRSCDDAWSARYNELVQYKRDFGNCNVPKQCKAYPQLADWVLYQRRHFRRNSLPDVCIKRLNKIGFTWKFDKEDDWMERYNELVEFKQIHGHCNVPQTYQANIQLGKWVKRQRWFYKNKEYITQHRIAKLNQIGFDWDLVAKVNANIWMKQYNDLVKYKSEFGDCNVPYQWKANRSLANWVHRQRENFKSKTLSESYIAKLNEIGFTWKFDKENDWMKRYQELIEYKHQFEDCFVNHRYEKNPQLGDWVQFQLGRFKRNTLQKSRVEKLNQIGFVWEIISMKK